MNEPKKTAKKGGRKPKRPIGVPQLLPLPHRILEGVRPWRERLPEGTNPFVSAGSTTPPEGAGHFDRYYFSSCAPDCKIENAVVAFHEVGMQLIYDGQIEGGEIGEAKWLEAPFTTQDAHLTAMVHWDGRVFGYQASFHIPPENAESIACIAAGVCLFEQEENGAIVQSLGAFGSAVSNFGTWYAAEEVKLA